MDRHSVIILADPDAQRRQALGQALSGAGLDVSSWPGYQSALKATAEREPAAVLCAATPEIDDAMSFCRRCKTQYPQVPLLVFAPQLQEVTRLRFLELGADEFVPAAVVVQTLPTFWGAEEQPPTLGLTAAAPAAPTQPATQMYLKLSQGELGSVLQFLAGTSRSGELVLTFTGGGPDGCIFLDRGRIVHAECDQSQGVEAVALMFAHPEGEARFLENRSAPNCTITATPSQLLIEAAVLADEVVALRLAVAPDHVPVVVGTSADLGSDHDVHLVLGQIDGTRTAAEILAAAETSEIRAKLALKRLVDCGAVRLFSREDLEAANLARLEEHLERLREHYVSLEGYRERSRFLTQVAELLLPSGLAPPPTNEPPGPT